MYFIVLQWRYVQECIYIYIYEYIVHLSNIYIHGGHDHGEKDAERGINNANTLEFQFDDMLQKVALCGSQFFICFYSIACHIYIFESRQQQDCVQLFSANIHQCKQKMFGILCYTRLLVVHLCNLKWSRFSGLASGCVRCDVTGSTNALIKHGQ